MARIVSLTGGSPWGITLSGGKDFGAHLQVSKVTPGGKASRGGVKQGDYILEINGEPTEGLLHFDAQQMIKATGSSLQFKLSHDPPKSPAITAKFSHESETTPTQPGGRPRPPPPPAGTSQAPGGKSGPATYTVVSYKTTAAQPKSPPQSTPQSRPQAAPQAASQPPPEPSTLVPDSGLGSGSSSSQQSPAFKRISIDNTPSPSVLSPGVHKEPLSPTQRMQNIHIEDTNVTKSSQRPQPPPSSPSKFSTSTVKVPKKEPPFSKPAPPPGGKPEPPSPTRAQEQQKLVERQGVCAACDQPIRGPFASAMGRSWHPDHFVCSSCSKQLQNTTFVFEEEKIFCDGCYEKVFAQKCYGCRRPILGPSIAALGMHWHQEHFTCSRCNGDLSKGQGFNMMDGNLFCGDCYAEQYGATCNGCGQKIGGDELWIEALDATWHQRCFICESCRNPLEGSTFFNKLGRPYCQNCV